MSTSAVPAADRTETPPPVAEFYCPNGDPHEYVPRHCPKRLGLVFPRGIVEPLDLIDKDGHLVTRQLERHGFGVLLFRTPYAARDVFNQAAIRNFSVRHFHRLRSWDRHLSCASPSLPDAHDPSSRSPDPALARVGISFRTAIVDLPLTLGYVAYLVWDARVGEKKGTGSKIEHAADAIWRIAGRSTAPAMVVIALNAGPTVAEKLPQADLARQSSKEPPVAMAGYYRSEGLEWAIGMCDRWLNGGWPG